MRIWLSAFAAFPLLFSLLACTKSPVMIDRVLVQNATVGRITDVTVRHEPTKKFGAVNAILPGKALEIGLSGGGQPLLAQQAFVQWRDADDHEWTVVLDLPSEQNTAEEKQPVSLIYIIYPSGRANVRLRGL
jgi:hypothetical protein